MNLVRNLIIGMLVIIIALTILLVGSVSVLVEDYGAGATATYGAEQFHIQLTAQAK